MPHLLYNLVVGTRNKKKAFVAIRNSDFDHSKKTKSSVILFFCFTLRCEADLSELIVCMCIYLHFVV